MNLLESFKKTDISINVILPLFIGLAIYISDAKGLIPGYLNNHMADGVWAYSFQSCMLIIWERKIYFICTLATILCASSYEMLQFLNIFPGTADLTDVLFYLSFISIALAFNKFFKQKMKYEENYQN